jgi:hypothetical protein
MSNAIRTSYQTLGSTLALQLVQTYGDTVTFTTGAGVSNSIYALALPAKTTETFGPDEDRMIFLVPYQTNFTSNPDSGATITINGVMYACESTNSDDGEFPTSFEVTCFRWMHPAAEIQ